MTAAYNEMIYNFSSLDVCTFTNGSPLPTALTAFEGVFLIVTFIAGTVVNVLFTVVVITQKALHQRDIVLNMLLTVLHIINGFVSNLTHLVSLVTGNWVFGMPACYLVGNAIFFIGLLRYVLVLVITVDRFGAVMYPFKYPQHARKVISVVIAIDTTLHPLRHHVPQSREGPPIIAAHVWRSLEPVHITLTSPESSPASLQSVVTGLLLLLSLVLLATPLQFYFAARIFVHIDNSLQQVSTAALLAGNLYYLIPIADGLVVMRNREVKASLAAIGKKLACCRPLDKNKLPY